MKDNKITIFKADNTYHLIIKVWDHNLFGRTVTIEGNKRPKIQKEYTIAVLYFTKHLTAIKFFETASDGVPKK